MVIRLRRSYNARQNSSKFIKRLASMKNDYAIQIYYKGNYPQNRGGTDVGDVATFLNSGIKSANKGHDPEDPTMPNPESENPRGRGRPKSTKKWPWEKQVRSSHHKEWRRYINGTVKKLLRGWQEQVNGQTVNFRPVRNIREAYANLGRQVVEQLREQIIGTIAPELEYTTIRKRRKRGVYSTKPLIETLKLLRSIHSRVVPISSLEGSESSSAGRLASMATSADERTSEFSREDARANDYDRLSNDLIGEDMDWFY